MKVNSIRLAIGSKPVVEIPHKVVERDCVPLSELSARQLDALRFIKRYVADHGYPPTMGEIGAAAGIKSKSDVKRNLGLLADAGYIKCTPHISRGISLTDAGKAVPAGAQP